MAACKLVYEDPFQRYTSTPLERLSNRQKSARYHKHNKHTMSNGTILLLPCSTNSFVDHALCSACFRVHCSSLYHIHLGLLENAECNKQTKTVEHNLNCESFSLADPCWEYALHAKRQGFLPTHCQVWSDFKFTPLCCCVHKCHRL